MKINGRCVVVGGNGIAVSLAETNCWKILDLEDRLVACHENVWIG